jgi:hypothetical protein
VDAVVVRATAGDTEVGTAWETVDELQETAVATATATTAARRTIPDRDEPTSDSLRRTR